MRIKRIKTSYGTKITFNGKYCRGLFYEKGGSGYLQATAKPYICDCSEYFREDGTHNMRASDIYKLAKYYDNVYKELKRVEKFKKLVDKTKKD